MTSPLLELVSTRATWARVESGFHVASRDGEFVGYVDQARDGSFLAFDGRSTPVGRYDTLKEAQRAVLSVPTTPVPDEGQRRRLSVLHRVAVVAGVVAGGVALTAGAVVPYL
ncbi:MAG: peptide ABC transporter permease [Candidatus Microbacterium phytovorans]|uniref:Peptide ABC transporter permease n=1 Tax=Candidatus Microbacterium phytovorans TaxID=3121374 RepID=A0AAJ5W301_9MICO|nr:peptide ABC transporter permease [Microbacterium sp.]WEK14889.1 MAG: peptide ABC transporter permease [Microbacterium sp.]